MAERSSAGASVPRWRWNRVLPFRNLVAYLGPLPLDRDTDGYVAIWHLRTYRPRYLWKAHDGGILGLQEFDGGVLTSVPFLSSQVSLDSRHELTRDKHTGKGATT